MRVVVDTRCGNGLRSRFRVRKGSDERIGRIGAFVNHGHKVSIRR